LQHPPSLPTRRSSDLSRTAAASHHSATPPASHASPAPRAAPHAADASPYDSASLPPASPHPQRCPPYHPPQSSGAPSPYAQKPRSEEHTSELQSRQNL